MIDTKKVKEVIWGSSAMFRPEFPKQIMNWGLPAPLNSLEFYTETHSFDGITNKNIVPSPAVAEAMFKRYVLEMTERFDGLGACSFNEKTRNFYVEYPIYDMMNGLNNILDAPEKYKSKKCICLKYNTDSGNLKAVFKKGAESKKYEIAQKVITSPTPKAFTSRAVIFMMIVYDMSFGHSSRLLDYLQKFGKYFREYEKSDDIYFKKNRMSKMKETVAQVTSILYARTTNSTYSDKVDRITFGKMVPINIDYSVPLFITPETECYDYFPKIGKMQYIGSSIPGNGELEVKSSAIKDGHGVVSTVTESSQPNRKGIYAPSDRALSKELAELIPKRSTDLQDTKEADEIGKHIQLISKCRNILLRGPAGVGKTYIAQEVAYLLGRPYYCFSCTPDTDESTLLRSILPEVEDKVANQSKEEFIAKLPSPFDMEVDPGKAYIAITGVEKENATVTDCYFAIHEALKNYESELSSLTKFTKVDSPIIKGVVNGGVVEIQEATVIRNPGALVALNSLLNEGVIELATGEKIVRHPDSVIMFTANVDYDGIHSLNQSVISRCNLIMDMDMPSDDVVINRITRQTGMSDNEAVEKMVDVMHQINAELERNGCTDGTCGIRELINWAASAKVTNDIYKSALLTVVPASTADKDVQAKVLTCVETRFKAA